MLSTYVFAYADSTLNFSNLRQSHYVPAYRNYGALIYFEYIFYPKSSTFASLPLPSATKVDLKMTFATAGVEKCRAIQTRIREPETDSLPAPLPTENKSNADIAIWKVGELINLSVPAAPNWRNSAFR